MKYTCLALRSLVVAIALWTSACTGSTASTGAPVTPAAMAGAATTEAPGPTAPAAAVPSTPAELPVAAGHRQPSLQVREHRHRQRSRRRRQRSRRRLLDWTPDEGVEQIVGTVVRFSARSTSVDVTIGEDNPAVRDFLSRLPLTLTLEDLVGREKIAYLSPELAHAGSPGSDPEDGDLIYYVAWGNIGFYYNAAGSTIRTRRSISEPTTHRSINSHSSRGPDVSVEVVR